MSKRPASTLDPSKIKTPAFVIEEDLLRHNLGVLKSLREKAKCKVLLAIKAWATWPLFKIAKPYLSGTEVSSLNEAKLGFEEFGPEVHIYAPAYKKEEFGEILKNCSHIIFNSFGQWEQFKPQLKAFEKKTKKHIECGLRINPEVDFGDHEEDMYNPCAADSRLGIRMTEFDKAVLKNPKALEGISGMHFHIFFEKNVEDLEKALVQIEARFGKDFAQMKWVNFGGGQKITDDNYDTERLASLIKGFKERYGVDVHLEPGAAVSSKTGTLVASVLDIVEREGVPYKVPILDISFEAHLMDFLLTPDLELEIRGAKILGSSDNKKLALKGHVYQFGGGTCLAGDKISRLYSFPKELKVGDKIVFEDAIQYTLVKITMFNGVQHPDIVHWKKDAKGKYGPKVLRHFGYEDFKKRMG